MKNPVISYFDGGITNTTRQYKISIEKLFSGITTNQDWKKQIDQVRAVLLKHGKGSEYKAAKAKLPYFMPSGIWSNRTENGKLIKGSDLIQIDVDDLLDNTELERIRAALMADKHTLLLFKSPSGAGLKGLATHEPDKAPHRASLEEFYSNLEIKIDPSTLFKKQPCYIGYDEQAYLNLNAEPFDLPEYKQAPKKPGEGVKFSNNTANSGAAHVQAYCRKIITQSADYVRHATTGQGCDSLNRAAYKCGMYAVAGLNKEDAAAALWQAFNERNSNHSEKEFIRIFERGFEAGRTDPQMIKDRPAIQQRR